MSRALQGVVPDEVVLHTTSQTLLRADSTLDEAYCNVIYLLSDLTIEYSLGHPPYDEYRASDVNTRYAEEQRVAAERRVAAAAIAAERTRLAAFRASLVPVDCTWSDQLSVQPDARHAAALARRGKIIAQYSLCKGVFAAPSPDQGRTMDVYYLTSHNMDILRMLGPLPIHEGCFAVTFADIPVSELSSSMFAVDTLIAGSKMLTVIAPVITAMFFHSGKTWCSIPSDVFTKEFEFTGIIADIDRQVARKDSASEQTEKLQKKEAPRRQIRLPYSVTQARKKPRKAAKKHKGARDTVQNMKKKTAQGKGKETTSPGAPARSLRLLFSTDGSGARATASGTHE